MYMLANTYSANVGEYQICCLLLATSEQSLVFLPNTVSLRSFLATTSKVGKTDLIWIFSLFFFLIWCSLSLLGFSILNRLGTWNKPPRLVRFLVSLFFLYFSLTFFAAFFIRTSSCFLGLSLSVHQEWHHTEPRPLLWLQYQCWKHQLFNMLLCVTVLAPQNLVLGYFDPVPHLLPHSDFV